MTIPIYYSSIFSFHLEQLLKGLQDVKVKNTVGFNAIHTTVFEYGDITYKMTVEPVRSKVKVKPLMFSDVVEGES